MTCTGAENVHAIAVDGSFDDAQRVLKEIFGDHAFSRQHRLSAVNSINLARILAQCVYYLSAWLRLPHSTNSTGSSQASPFDWLRVVSEVEPLRDPELSRRATKLKPLIF